MFECSVCKEKFQRKNSTLRHENDIHSCLVEEGGKTKLSCEGELYIGFDTYGNYAYDYIGIYTCAFDIDGNRFKAEFSLVLQIFK